VPISEAGVGRLHEATGWPVLAAAAATQSAFEPDIPGAPVRHGYFTYALLHALSHADTSGNGLIELGEPVAHVQGAVPKIVAGKGLLPRSLTTLATTAKQSPRFGSRGEMSLSRNASGSVPLQWKTAKESQLYASSALRVTGGALQRSKPL
jgi:hypothetical protein